MEGEQSRSLTSAVLCGLAAALLLYVLSIGPVAKIMELAYGSVAARAFVVERYRPVLIAAHQSEFTLRWLHAYLGWWAVSGYY